jgi:hypothetical protein
MIEDAFLEKNVEEKFYSFQTVVTYLVSFAHVCGWPVD